MTLPIIGRAVVFVDGFNLYHSLDSTPGFKKYKWLDLWRLSQRFVPAPSLKRVLYFTAYADWNQQKTQRHNTYVRALKSKGVEIILGRFKLKTLICRATCRLPYQTYEEKRTDVNIAVQMVDLAHRNGFDDAILITGDTDIAPAVEAVTCMPGKRVFLVSPPGRRVQELENICTGHQNILGRHLGKSLLENPVVLSDGANLVPPPSWI